MESKMRDELWPRFCSERMSMWPHAKQSAASGVSPAVLIVCERLERAFRNVKPFPLERIFFQFWLRVRTRTGATMLSCAGTPFAFPPANHRLRRYKARSCLYSYAVAGDVELDDPMTITHAPPAFAFITGFPEVVLDLTPHRGTPLVDLALEAELTCFMMLPLFSHTKCLGVIEVSARFPRHLLLMFDELHREIQRVGLSLTRPKAMSLPWKALPGDLSLARTEVANALNIAVVSHALTLAQVWTPYVARHRPRLSIRLLRKLTSYCLHTSDRMSLLQRSYHHLVYLPLANPSGLLARTLETRQPHLCRSIHNFTHSRGFSAILSASTNTDSACFVICLRSSHTADLDHVFEFFWPQHRDHVALVEALLSTLRQHLPSFRYDSGALLGDRLLVADADTSPPVTLEIFPGRKKAAGIKRKTRASAPMVVDSQSNQHPLTNICTDPEEEHGGDLAMLAVYKIDRRLFFLPSSSTTFESLMEKINLEFELDPAATYTIEYQVLPGEWHSLTDDTCLNSCIATYRASKNVDHIKLCVLDS